MSFIENVQSALKRFREIFPATPLQYSKFLSDKYDAQVFLKREDQTPVRSYKIRGAFYFISEYLKENEYQPTKFVCASAGNHAQGFAFSCAAFKMSGTVFMPVTTPQQKIARTSTLGGEYVKVKLIGDTFDDASKAAQAFQKKEKAVYVPPFDHEKIIQGQATIAAEILTQIDDPECDYINCPSRPEKIDVVTIPVGGGGVSAGVSTYFQEKSPDTEIYCAEPFGAPSLKSSLEAGKLVELDHIESFVDGAAVKKIGELNFKILHKNIKNEVILCPENRICKTIMSFLFHDGIILEPAGALSIDALRDLKDQIKGKTVVCIVSGGNFDFERLPDVKERAMRFTGTKRYLILQLPQRPGALKEFLEILGPEDDIARFEYLKKSAKAFGSVLLGIETTQAENFETLFKNLKAKGFQFRDVTDDELLADFVI